MRNVLLGLQVAVSVLLIGCILLQAKGTGLGSTLMSGELYTTKRGLEKVVFSATIVLASIFGVVSMILLAI